MKRASVMVALLAVIPILVPSAESQDLEEQLRREQRRERELMFRQGIEETSQLIVMITDQLGSAPSFGAGILLGRDHDRLYIATANHVVRRGKQEPTSIRVALKFEPNKSVPAKLLDRCNPSLDVAVLAIEGWAKQGIAACSIHFGTSLAVPRFETSIVYAIGNPNGDAWRPPSPDTLVSAAPQELRFRSAFLGVGFSGGGLLDERGVLAGMVVRDEPPMGSAVPLDAVLQLVASWGYPVQLHNLNYEGDHIVLEKAARTGDIVALTAEL